MGTVRLSVNNEKARTILPANPENNDTLNFFHVIFKPSTESPQGTFREFPVKGKLQDVLDTRYPVPEGCYEGVEVLAFTTNYWDNDYLGAIGRSEKFEIKSTVAYYEIEIALNTLADNPDIKITHGYFNWDIDNSKNNLDYSTVGDTAKMTITPLTGGTAEDTVYFLVKGFKNKIQLDTGIYNVSFEFGRDSHSYVKFSEILYIGTGGAISYYDTYTIPPLVSIYVRVYYNLNNPLAKNEPSSGWAIPVGSLYTSLPLPSFPPDSYSFDPTAKFKGWHKDKAGTKIWNGYDRVLSETTLYAKWEVTYTTSVPTGIELKLIPAGTFMMGSPAGEAYHEAHEGPQHDVTLSNFYIGKYEITQKQYQDVMGINPSYFTAAVPLENGTPGKLPVEQITWYDAVEFCNKLSVRDGRQEVYTITSRYPLTGYPITIATVTMDMSKNGYRLPTEAEWEYACRAGTTTMSNNGNNDYTNTALFDAVAWYGNTSESKTHEVGLKQPNAWGLYDMHGNVFEWCWDWYDSSYYTSNPVSNPLGANTGSNRVIRGGALFYGVSSLRSAYKYTFNPGGLYRDLGFRVVRGL